MFKISDSLSNGILCVLWGMDGCDVYSDESTGFSFFPDAELRLMRSIWYELRQAWFLYGARLLR